MGAAVLDVKAGLSEQSLIWLESLLESARTAPYLFAFEHLAQAEGIVGFACIEQMITREEHAAFWATINEIKNERAAERRKLEEATVCPRNRKPPAVVTRR